MAEKTTSKRVNKNEKSKESIRKIILCQKCQKRCREKLAAAIFLQPFWYLWHKIDCLDAGLTFFIYSFWMSVLVNFCRLRKVSKRHLWSKVPGSTIFGNIPHISKCIVVIHNSQAWALVWIKRESSLKNRFQTDVWRTRLRIQNERNVKRV